MVGLPTVPTPRGPAAAEAPTAIPQMRLESAATPDAGSNVEASVPEASLREVISFSQPMAITQPDIIRDERVRVNNTRILRIALHRTPSVRGIRAGGEASIGIYGQLGFGLSTRKA